MRRGLLKQHAMTLLIGVCLIDFVLAYFTGLLAYLIRFGYQTISVRYYFAVLIGALLIPIIFNICGVYQSLRGQQIFSQFKRIFLGIILTYIALMLLIALLKQGIYFSRVWLFSWMVFAFVAIIIVRICLYSILRVLRKHKLNQRRIIIYGAGKLGKNLCNAVKENLWTGYQVQSFIDDDPEIQGAIIDSIKVINPPVDIDQYIKEHDIDEVWIALSLSSINRVGNILHELRFSTVNVKYVPDISAFELLNHSITEIMGFPVINVKTTPMEGCCRIVKSIEDKCLSFIILILISPLLLLIVLLVKLSSPGPVFYIQKRMSWNGDIFKMLKFRTMPVGAEKETGAIWAKATDNRATKIGVFLRKTSLDELPQFINVLKGDMSIVGPRPERPELVEKFKEKIPRYMQKHLVKAGITGWAQINGWRGNTDLNKRIEYDLYYIEYWSLWFDLKIICLTFFKGIVNKNAY